MDTKSMIKKSIGIFILLIIVIIYCKKQLFCSKTGRINSISKLFTITEEVSMIDNELKNDNQQIEKYGDKEKLKIYGTWNLDKIVLTSKNYIGEKNWGDGHIFSEEHYIGYEVEYTPEYLRLGEQKFFSPTYKVSQILFYEFIKNGDFEYPDLYCFVKEGVEIDDIGAYENMGDIPLDYYLVTFKDNNFIPVGTQCVFLNENTMLVGVWGNVFLSHRVE